MSFIIKFFDRFDRENDIIPTNNTPMNDIPVDTNAPNNTPNNEPNVDSKMNDESDSDSNSDSDSVSPFLCFGYKKANKKYIVKLGIPIQSVNNLNRPDIFNDEYALFKTNRAIVIDITHIDGNEKVWSVASDYDPNFIYTVGDCVTSEIDENIPCPGKGIYFFKSYEAAHMYEIDVPALGTFTYKIWYANGHLHSLREYLDGQLHGTFRFWSESGMLNVDDQYEAGCHIDNEKYTKTKQIEKEYQCIGYITDIHHCGEYMIKMGIPKEALINHHGDVIDANYALFNTNIIDILSIYKIDKPEVEVCFINNSHFSKKEENIWEVGMRIVHDNFDIKKPMNTSYGGYELYTRGLCFYKTLDGALCGRTYAVPLQGLFIRKVCYKNGRINYIEEFLNNRNHNQEIWWDEDGKLSRICFYNNTGKLTSQLFFDKKGNIIKMTQ